MLASMQSLQRPGLPSALPARPASLRARPANSPAVRCQAQPGNDRQIEVPARGERLGVWLTGIAATCMALNPMAASAEVAAPPAPALDAKKITTELQAVLKERGETLAKLESAPQVGAEGVSVADVAKARQGLQATLETQNAKAKKLTADLESVIAKGTKSNQELQAQLSKNADVVKKLTTDLEAAKKATNGNAAEVKAKLDKENAAMMKLKADVEAFKKELDAEKALLTQAQSQAKQAQKQAQQAETQKLMMDLETSKKAAIKSVEALQSRLASEHAKVQKLQTDLEAAKKEVESEKKLLVDAQKKAADAAAAAAAAARKGIFKVPNTGLEMTMQQALTGAGGLAVAGWGVAGALALNKNDRDRDLRSIERESLRSLSQMDGSRNIRAAEQVRGEAEAVRRELSAVKNQLGDLSRQLDQERSQNATLRETVVILEADYARMESQMYAAKSDAFELQNKLDEVLGEASKSKPSSFSRPATKFDQPPPRTKFDQPSGNKFEVLPSVSNNAVSTSSAGSRAGSALGSRGGVKVRFTLKKELPFGQSLKLVGSHPALGDWAEAKGQRMTWGDGHVWTADVPLAPGTALEFKCVSVVDNGSAESQWEDGPNHVLIVPSSGASNATVTVEWGGGTSVTTQRAGEDSFSAQKKKELVSANIGSSSSSSSGRDRDSSRDRDSGSSSSGGSKKWRGLLG